MKPNLFRSLKHTLMLFAKLPRGLREEKKVSIPSKVLIVICVILFWWVLIPVITIDDFITDAKRYKTKVSKNV